MDDLISRQAAIDAMLGDKVEITNVIRALGNERDFEVLNCTCDRHAQIIKDLPTVQPTITHEQAIDYLHETGWLQKHDRILTESKVPLKGAWKDFTDEGYVECPFCKSATNCESKEDIDDLHFCFSCGAMLRRGESE